MSIGGNRTRYIADMHAQETNRLSTSVSVYKCDNITPSQVQPQVARTSKIRMQEKPVLGLYKKTDCRKLSESRSSLEYVWKIGCVIGVITFITYVFYFLQRSLSDWICCCGTCAVGHLDARAVQWAVLVVRMWL